MISFNLFYFLLKGSSRSFFRKLDLNGDGQISFQEFRQLVGRLAPERASRRVASWAPGEVAGEAPPEGGALELVEGQVDEQGELIGASVSDIR